MKKEYFYTIKSGKKRKMCKTTCEYCGQIFSYRSDTKRKTNRCQKCSQVKIIKKNDIINGVKIEKDLGMTSGIHYVLIKCNKCNILFKRNLNVITKYGTTTCKSCSSKIHGKSNTRLYNIWCGIKSRCFNKKDKKYKYYGGKGVTICDEWKNNYQAFEKWALQNGYKDNLTIDKDILCKKLNIYPKIYSPKTCKWVTYNEQNCNLSIKNKLNAKGITLSNGKFEVRVVYKKKMLFRKNFQLLKKL